MSIFIAHRGLSAQAPENTCAAFDLAWSHDCAGIELDIQVTRDGYVVVQHDEHLSRTAGKDIEVMDTDYDVLSRLPMLADQFPQYPDEPMPLLSKVLDEMPAGKVVMIEVKPSVTNLEPIFTLLKKMRTDIKAYVMSFSLPILFELQKHLPELPILWVLEREDVSFPDTVMEAKQYGFTGIHIDHEAISDIEQVRLVHGEGLELGVWTVNDDARYQQLREMDIEMILGDKLPAVR